MTRDLLTSAGPGRLALLIMLDSTATFDHLALSYRLAWLSYLTDRQFYHSPLLQIFCVPQGSVLGPLQFNIDLLPVGHIIFSHGLITCKSSLRLCSSSGRTE